jgi:ribosomal protein L11 methylase PrmA
LLGHILVRAAVPPRAPSDLAAPDAPAPDLADLLTRVPRTPCVVPVHIGNITLALEQGIIFGTGQHPTTRLALACIRRYVRLGMRMLDLGTGTGILAIAAAKLGAAAVLALDVDPDAVWLATRNVA